MWIVPIAATALLASRLLLACVLIPPWQQPDEPTLFALTQLQASRISGFQESADPGREGEVLRSMATYEWWRHRAYGFPVPDVPPKRFVDAGQRVADEVIGIDNPPTYYHVAARVLTWGGGRSLVQDLYLLRAFSAVLGMLTLWIAWLGARQSLGSVGGAAVAGVLALHPQFAVVATAATPDAMVNLMGALMWWQAARACTHARPLWPLVGVWAAAIGAAAADRMGVPLLAAAFLTTGMVLAARTRMSRRALLVAGSLAAAAVVVFAAVVVMIDRSTDGFALVATLVRRPERTVVLGWSLFSSFTWYFHQGWWFTAGWSRYFPPLPWTIATVLLTAVAVAGSTRVLVRRDGGDSQKRILTALAVLVVGIQLAAVYFTYFRMGDGAQGRYLFPVLLPTLVLLWTGIESFVPQSRRLHAAVALVSIVALLDATAWTLVVSAAYSVAG